MFDTTKTPVTERLVDAADLVIDFATLGEYGLEPVEASPRPCEARVRRDGHRRSTGAWARAVDRFAVPA